jgi:multiple sugar transport system ATP-binding protein
MNFLTLAQLSKTFPDGTTAVKAIDLSVSRGQFVVLLGPSGCGKTTTLRMIAGLELPTSGTITLDGNDVTSLRPSERDVGFVFQFYALYPHLCVKDNIAFPLVAMGLSGREIERVVSETADRLGLTALLRRYPKQLSGGDQQRVSLARAIVRNPKLWLMDEPLGTLDADQRLLMREFLRARQLEASITTLYVTHDQEEAMSLADLVVVMDAGEIRQIGTPADVYDRPNDRFVANFVGSPGMNFVEGQIESAHFIAHGLRLPLRSALANQPATLGVRPEHVRLDSSGPISGPVVLDEYLGSHRFLHVQTPTGRVVARVGVDQSIDPQSPVALAPDATQVHLFGSNGRRIA